MKPNEIIEPEWERAGTNDVSSSLDRIERQEIGGRSLQEKVNTIYIAVMMVLFLLVVIYLVKTYLEMIGVL